MKAWTHPPTAVLALALPAIAPTASQFIASAAPRASRQTFRAVKSMKVTFSSQSASSSHFRTVVNSSSSEW